LPAPIRTNDSPEDQLSKLLPADVTAAFLSAKAALLAALGEPGADMYIFWTFVGILVLCPFYFWFVTQAKNVLQVAFLCTSFVVFATSIASKELLAALTALSPSLGKAGPFLSGAAIVLPILWAFLIARIFAAAFANRLVASGGGK
jgi:hypothetical protein